MRTIIILMILVCLSMQLLYGQGIHLGSGTQMVVQGNLNVVLTDGKFTNDGTLSAGTSSFYMKGSTADTSAVLGGTSTSRFYNLVIDKTSNGIQLSQDIEVDNELNFTSGKLDLNGNDITLTNDGRFLNESETNRIWGDSGEVVKTLLLNTPFNLNPGNIGVEITSFDNIGMTTIRRGVKSHLVNGRNSMNVYYQVNHSGVSTDWVDYIFHYWTADLNGIAEPYLSPWAYQSSWKEKEPAFHNPTNNFLALTNVAKEDTLWTFSTGQLQLSPKVLLAGAYDSQGLMNDKLRVAGVIPITEPFTDLGINLVNCNCDSTTQAVLLDTMVANDVIVDWTLVELRLKTNKDSVLQSVTALLQKDGDIVDVDGTSPIKIPNLQADSFFIVVKHRNHLGIMSKNYQLLRPLVSSYDFTTNIANTEGEGLGVQDSGDGYFLMYSGDVNSDGQVQNSDGPLLISKLGSSGYLREDLDMDSQVQNTDLTNKLRPNLGAGVQFGN